MEEHRLTQLLHQMSAEVPGKTRFCPEDEEVVKYYEGKLETHANSKFRQHLADCRFCLARVGNLGRLGEKKHFEAVASATLADAKCPADQPLSKQTRYLPVWATAAVLVLSLFTFGMLGERSGTVPVASDPDLQQNPRQIRSIDRLALIPAIISPTDGDQVRADELTIRWTGILGSLHYDVRVVDLEGFIVWNDRVEGVTEWSPPINTLLEPGMAYFVRVDAYMAEANSVSSEHILFTVVGAQE